MHYVSLLAGALLASLVAPVIARAADASAASPDAIVVTHAGAQASTKGSDSWFTGMVRVDPLFPAREPSRVSAGSVTFEPGARSAWHTHPLGQTLIVTSGAGRVQRWGMPADEIKPGDVIWIPPGQKHWHGAAPTTGLTHIAIQEAVDGKNVNWMEKVSDEQYASAR